MKEVNFISCVIYLHKIHNKQDGEKFVENLYHGLLQNFKNYEVILVNDSCRGDELSDFINMLCVRISRNDITIIDMADYSGIENSMLAGDDLAIGDYIFEFEVLGVSYPQELLMDIYHKCQTGYDIVSARPEHNKYFASKIFYALYNMGVDKQNRIYSETFRVISRRAYNRVSAFGKIIPYRKTFYASCGLRRYAIVYDNSSYGRKERIDHSEMAYKIRLAINSLLMFTKTPRRFILGISLCFLLLFVTIAYRAFDYYFHSQEVVPGWTTTMLYLSAAFFGIFVIMAVVIKYLSLILNTILKNKSYHVESVYKSTNDTEMSRTHGKQETEKGEI